MKKCWFFGKIFLVLFIGLLLSTCSTTTVKSQDNKIFVSWKHDSDKITVKQEGVSRTFSIPMESEVGIHHKVLSFYAVQISPSNKYIIAGSCEHMWHEDQASEYNRKKSKWPTWNFVTIWDAKSGEILYRLDDGMQLLRQKQFTDYKWVNLANLAGIGKFGITKIAIHPTETLIAAAPHTWAYFHDENLGATVVGGIIPWVTIWDIRTGQAVEIINKEGKGSTKDKVQSLRFNEDGTKLYVLWGDYDDYKRKNDHEVEYDVKKYL